MTEGYEHSAIVTRPVPRRRRWRRKRESEGGAVLRVLAWRPSGSAVGSGRHSRVWLVQWGKTAEATHHSPAKSSVVSTSPWGVHYRDIRFTTASARVEELIVASGSVGAVGVGSRTTESAGHPYADRRRGRGGSPRPTAFGERGRNGRRTLSASVNRIWLYKVGSHGCHRTTRRRRVRRPHGAPDGTALAIRIVRADEVTTALDSAPADAGGPRRRGLRSPSFRSPACSGRRAPIAGDRPGHRRAGPSETVRKRPVSVGHKPYVAIRNGAAGTSILPRGQRGPVVPTVTLGTSAFPGSGDSFPSARLLPRRVGALSAATIGEGSYSP